MQKAILTSLELYGLNGAIICSRSTIHVGWFQIHVHPSINQKFKNNMQNVSLLAKCGCIMYTTIVY
jgi:hypothetical protein